MPGVLPCSSPDPALGGAVSGAPLPAGRPGSCDLPAPGAGRRQVRHCSPTRAITEPPRHPGLLHDPPAVRSGCSASGAPAAPRTPPKPRARHSGRRTAPSRDPGTARPPSPGRPGLQPPLGPTGNRWCGEARGRQGPAGASGRESPGRPPARAGAAARGAAAGGPGRAARARSLPRAPAAAHLGLEAPRCCSVPPAPRVPPGGAARTRPGRPAGPSSRPPYAAAVAQRPVPAAGVRRGDSAGTVVNSAAGLRAPRGAARRKRKAAAEPGSGGGSGPGQARRSPGQERWLGAEGPASSGRAEGGSRNGR